MNPKLFLDEDIKPGLARLLEDAGYDTRTVRDEGRLGLTDEEQFEFARAHGRVFVTYNFHDFEGIAQREAEAGRSHSGIIVSHHQYDDDQIGLLARALIALLDGRTAEGMVNAYLVLRRATAA